MVKEPAHVFLPITGCTNPRREPDANGSRDCGGCWHDLMRAHGLGPTQSLLDAMTEVVGKENEKRRARERRAKR